MVRAGCGFERVLEVERKARRRVPRIAERQSEGAAQEGPCARSCQLSGRPQRAANLAVLGHHVGAVRMDVLDLADGAELRAWVPPERGADDVVVLVASK